MLPINIESGLFIFFSLLYAIAFYVNLYLHQKNYSQAQNDIYYDQEVGEFNKFILKSPVLFFIIWTAFIFFLNWILIQIDFQPVQQFLFGMLIATFTMLSGSEIGGIIIFKNIISSSKEIAKRANHRLTILHHLASLIPATLIVVPLYVMHKTTFILGTLCGTILQCLILLMRVIRTK
jgi:hypothetical protein